MQESAYKRMYQTATDLIEGHTAHEDRILEGFFPTDLWDHRIPAFRLDMVLDNDNIPLVYTPDFTKTEEYKKDTKKRDKLRITREKAQTFQEKRDFLLKQRKRQKDLLRASNTLSGISR